MPTPPDELLRILATTVRAARQAMALSQAALAREAGVSLAQLALFEKGRNVSVLFLSKVATALHLHISLTADGTAPDSAADTARLDVFELIRRLDLLATLVADTRAYATTAVLSPTERGKLKDTPVVTAFIDRVLSDEEGVQRLADAMHDLSSEAGTAARPQSPPIAARQQRKKRARRGE